ncbi:unnamed protein product [Rodentolepis nana]|uniref:Pecanex-like protein n=1 Tax=Rodentolepis nana TaxID=102285 RepID=A0A0R3TQQ5_RODNA|nr:unnamed protein product [Rodentolepis nana]
MVEIAELENPINLQRNKKVRLTTFTSSASLVLSWPFPLIILCFQSNQRLIFDPRIYTALIMSFLFSGSVKRLLLQRFIKPTFLNAVIPTVLTLIGNGVFMTALYKGDNWNFISVFFMVGSRLCFGWSTYTAEDYNRRAKNATKSDREKLRLKQRVEDMVPDLQDAAFHAGVIVALIVCFILEVCFLSVGPQMSEFYSVLILSGFSSLISFLSVPSLHKAVNGIVGVPVSGMNDDHEPSSNQETNQSRSDMAVISTTFTSAVISRNNYFISTLFTSLSRYEHPPGQLIMMLFSALLTTSTILFDYLLLPYLVVYMRRYLFTANNGTYFPFPDFVFIYATLFASELVLRTLVLEYTDFGLRALRWAHSTLIGSLAGVAGVSFLMPTILYVLTNSTFRLEHSVYGLGLFVVCVVQGLLKAAHDLIGGVLFTKYCDIDLRQLRRVAETGEQLLGVMRCFFAAVFFIIGGAVLYHQRFMAALMMIDVVYTMALSVAVWGFVKVYSHEKSVQVRIEFPN